MLVNLGEYTQVVFGVGLARVYMLHRTEEKICTTQVTCSGYVTINPFFC